MFAVKSNPHVANGLSDLEELRVVRSRQHHARVAQAATVCDVSDQAIYYWLEHAARMRRPIAEKRANVWIIDTARLFAYVERHRGGLSARVKAESRLREFWPSWSEPQELRPGMKAHEPR